VAEKVVIDFSQSLDDTAQVSAWFRFHNSGNVDEHLKVRFPLNGESDMEMKASPLSEYPKVPLIMDFVVSNGSQAIPTEIVRDPDPNASDFFLKGVTVIYWAVFEVDFPAGQDIELIAHYTYKPTMLFSYCGIGYILATGAGWKGPIGTGIVIVRLPYQPSELNMSGSDDVAARYALRGMILSMGQNEILWEWDNLEPTREDNISFRIIKPSLWREILRWQAEVNKSPHEADAWVALARAYAAAGAYYNDGISNVEFANLYILSFENVLLLDPKNIALHEEFARKIYNSNYGGRDPYYDAIILHEVAAILKLDPQNVGILQLLSYPKAEEGYSIVDLPTPGGPFPTLGQPTHTMEWESLPTSKSNKTSNSTATPTFTSMGTKTPTLNATLTPLVTASTTPEVTSTKPFLSPEATGKDWSWLLFFIGFIFVSAIFLTGFGRRTSTTNESHPFQSDQLTR